MSQSTVKKIPNNYFDGMPVTGFHKIVFFIIMMAYFCEQMDNWNFGFIAPALMHTWGLQMSDIGVVTLWYFIGMTAGGFFGGVISDFIGRRKTFLISIATFSFFSVLNGFTDNFHVFVIARSMTGFGVFCLMVCSQAYIAEMAPAESRGKRKRGASSSTSAASASSPSSSACATSRNPPAGSWPAAGWKKRNRSSLKSPASMWTFPRPPRTCRPRSPSWKC